MARKILHAMRNGFAPISKIEKFDSWAKNIKSEHGE
jgi:hypothetical protein